MLERIHHLAKAMVADFLADPDYRDAFLTITVLRAVMSAADGWLEEGYTPPMASPAVPATRPRPRLVSPP
jgi:hypothetical protein